MFRSGRLTATRLNQIMRWVERMPHNLKAVAKACNIYPADLMAWYLAGQDPDCRDPLMTELAWRIAEVRAEAAARNYERIVAAADGGTKRKVVSKPKTDGEGAFEETTIEDVLPAAWAIERLEKMAEASVWEISPNAEQAAELHAMMRELEPTPLLPSGEADDPKPRQGIAALDEGGVEVLGVDGGEGGSPQVGVRPAVSLDVGGQDGVEVRSVDVAEEGARHTGEVVEADGFGGVNQAAHTQSMTDD